MITTARTRSTDGIDGKDAVGLYLDAIAKTPLLSAEEEVQLARAIEAGLFAREILDGNETTSTDATREELEQLVELGDQAMQRFIKANLRLVVSVARKYGRAQMPLLDLVQEGNTGLIRAVEKFDYTKGFKFSTYATWWVRQAISRGIAQQGRIVRLPVHVAEQVNQVSAVRRARRPDRPRNRPRPGRSGTRRGGTRPSRRDALRPRRPLRRRGATPLRPPRRPPGQAGRYRAALGDHRRTGPPDRAPRPGQDARIPGRRLTAIPGPAHPTGRISPSWAQEATSFPSWNSLPWQNPRAPEAEGETMS